MFLRVTVVFMPKSVWKFYSSWCVLEVSRHFNIVAIEVTACPFFHLYFCLLSPFSLIVLFPIFFSTTQKNRCCPQSVWLWHTSLGSFGWSQFSFTGSLWSAYTFWPGRTTEPTVHCPSQSSAPCYPPTHSKLSLCPDANLSALPPLRRHLFVGRSLHLPIQSRPQRLLFPGSITQPCWACGSSQRPSSGSTPTQHPALSVEVPHPDSQYAPPRSTHVSQVEFPTGCLCLQDPTI